MKMRRKTKRFTVILIIVALILAGMCFEKLKTDSYFVYPATIDVNSEHVLSHSMDFTHYLCTSDQLNQRTLSSLMNLKKANNDNSIFKLFFIMLFITTLIHTGFLYREFYIRKKSSIFLSINTIMRYIHNQDGQKG